MATLDFARLFRSSIGFDQLPSLFAHALEGADRATFVLRFQGEKIQEDLTFALMTEGGNRPTKTPQEFRRITLASSAPRSQFSLS